MDLTCLHFVWNTRFLWVPFSNEKTYLQYHFARVGGPQVFHDGTGSWWRSLQVGSCSIREKCQTTMLALCTQLNCDSSRNAFQAPHRLNAPTLIREGYRILSRFSSHIAWFIRNLHNHWTEGMLPTSNPYKRIPHHKTRNKPNQYLSSYSNET